MEIIRRVPVYIPPLLGNIYAVYFAPRIGRRVRRHAALFASAVADTRVHYSGTFGNTASGLTPYDRMTDAEHDECGAFGCVWMGG